MIGYVTLGTNDLARAARGERGMSAHGTSAAALLLLASTIACTAPARADVQLPEALTAAYTEAQCPSCAGWNEPQQPFRIHGSTYYVGTRGLSAVLIASAEGHVLIDAGLPNSAPAILANIRALGFDPAEIVLILNSHVHYDHAGGIAAVQHVSGARVVASPASASALDRGASGPDDPQYGLLLTYPAVSGVERIEPGDRFRVGPHDVVPYATAGHSPGGTSWTWRSCEDGLCVDVVYADSLTPLSADGFRYTDSDTYPGALTDYEQGFETLERLPCDILITTHPVSSSLWERLENGPHGLIDPQACRRYVGTAREQLARRLDSEKAAGDVEGEHQP